jgi:tRNA pseudouridine32 synthase/23S rRNA pseudouridine746 synthase
MAVAVHPLPPEFQQTPLPEQFTYPFCYEPHPLCIAAAGEVRRYVSQHPEWRDELQQGKMFGVLIVRPLSFLAAFSGTLGGQTRHEYFVPPVFDLMAPGCYFQEEEAAITDINRQIALLAPRLSKLEAGSALLRQKMEAELMARREQMKQSKAERDARRKSISADEMAENFQELIRQSQYEKAEYRRLKRVWEQRIVEEEVPLVETRRLAELLRSERHQRSIALQQWLFRQFVFLNALGETKSLPELFYPAVPPSGAGECCAPKLLQAAYKNGLQPLCMAEFWIGASPMDEVRLDGHYYPACNSKCRPILRHMLRGLNVEPNPLLASSSRALDLRIIYKDSEMAVVSKPAGLLSVPGKDDQPSVQEIVRRMFPQAEGPLIVHRLDMDTSGLMLIALTEEKYHQLQNLFLHRHIHKVYHALLEREMLCGQEGYIDLPLRPNIDDRPRQLVDQKHGKPAQTHYRVLGNKDGHALVELRPITGRTHQLRVHCAHRLGLDNPIVGDRLYGKPAERLMLHAKRIEIRPPSVSPAGEGPNRKVSHQGDLEGATFEDETDIT